MNYSKTIQRLARRPTPRHAPKPLPRHVSKPAPRPTPISRPFERPVPKPVPRLRNNKQIKQIYQPQEGIFWMMIH